MFETCEIRKGVLDSDGHVLVTGGPGSGKTTLALMKALKRINEGLTNGQRILFLSFSNAAVNRIVESASDWITKDQIKYLNVQTFHSFFWGILKTYGYLLGCPKKLKLLLPHDEKVFKAVAIDNPQTWKDTCHDLFIQEGRVVFDLFAPKTLELLKSRQLQKIIGKHYPLIIIDEAQDTDEEQWRCLCHLSDKTKLFCLADLEQQIYDFRPGVNPERIKDILETLTPYTAELGGQNNRSPNNEILQFGNDLLLNKPRKGKYAGVMRMPYKPDRDNRHKIIRQAVGILINEIEKMTGERPTNIAYLTYRSKGVTAITDALRGKEGEKEIFHKVLFDETESLLSSRIISFFLEPKEKQKLSEYLSSTLRYIAEIYFAKGSSTSIVKGRNLNQKADILDKGGKTQVTKLVKALNYILTILTEQNPLTGNPRHDWLRIRKMFRETEVEELQAVDRAAEYLMAFNRGKAISEGLSSAWRESGQYIDARRIVELALSHEQIKSDISDSSGIHVMTLHKSKGKEFDGVIIFEESRISPLDLLPVFCTTQWGKTHAIFSMNSIGDKPFNPECGRSVL